MERNITLDYFKIFLCTLVITSHYQPLFIADATTDIFGWIISNGISRIAVPCFFLINGYFLFNKIEDKTSVKKYLKKTFIIYAAWTVIYLGYFISRPDYLIAGYLFMGYYHLWYLAALIVVVIIFYALKKWIRNDRLLLLLGIVLYFIGYVLQFKVTDLPVVTSVKLFICRNALFFGFPFVFLGYYVKKAEKKLFGIKNIYWYIIIVGGLVLLAIESYFSFTRYHVQDFFAILLLVCPAILILILKKSKYTVNDGYMGQLSSGIYFVHPFAISFCSVVFAAAHPKYAYIGLILFFSVLLTAGVIEVNKRIKIFL